jgi:HSP90 family molecular chaperone
MAGTRTDPPEVAREITKKEDVTKTAVRQPKDKCEPESNFPSYGPSRRFVKPPDKLPLPTTASNRKVQYVQPIRTRKPDEIEQGEYNKFYESAANDKNGHMTHFIAEDEVTFKFLLFVSNNQPSKQFNKYGQAAENIKLYVGRVSITDDFKGVVDSDDLPLNVSRFKRDQRRQLAAITEEEDSGDRQDDGVCDDQHQKFTLPIHETTNPVNTT